MTNFTIYLLAIVNEIYTRAEFCSRLKVNLKENIKLTLAVVYKLEELIACLLRGFGRKPFFLACPGHSSYKSSSCATAKLFSALSLH